MTEYRTPFVVRLRDIKTKEYESKIAKCLKSDRLTCKGKVFLEYVDSVALLDAELRDKIDLMHINIVEGDK